MKNLEDIKSPVLGLGPVQARLLEDRKGGLCLASDPGRNRVGVFREALAQGASA